MGIELREITAAGLAVEYGYDLHGGFLCRNIRIAGAAMTDDADVLVKVDRVHLTELAHTGNGLEDAHGHRNLDVALHRAATPCLMSIENAGISILSSTYDMSAHIASAPVVP